ncbi:eCIS core domain-containing protein [Echinicola rosea]|uniref:eCIS core domain-containing protein n=1 Tax=Echinicola rosea TaxID=1807691 RepID=A0ABQ1V6U1_9BACT|nr:DUF4157 domain-containing protein [Echinicola rosea]GGF39449.1 hypothetical protein GCM10011339_29980 [Echinicola rosea]
MKHFSSKTNQSQGNPAQKQPENFFQAKLNMGQPGDKFEMEADQMADQVVSGIHETDTTTSPSPETTVQTQQEEELVTAETTEAEAQEKPLAESVTPVVQSQTEEEQVQEKEEEEELQTQDDEEFQKSLGASDDDDPNEGNVQAQSEHSKALSPQLEGQIKSGSGGSPMDPSTQSSMESGFGADFSGVNIHTDSSAVQMSSDLGAQAFTHGNDIYFNEGKYNPSSPSGQHLLAHELTHTIQQGSSNAVQGKMVQKEGEEEALSPPEGIQPVNESQNNFSFQDADGSLSTLESGSAKNLKIGKISISDFKGTRYANRFNPPFQLPTGRDTNQIENWKSSLNTAVTPLLNAKVSEATNLGGFSKEESEEDRKYFFKGKNDPEYIVFGNRAELLELSLIPIWDKDLSPASFQVDHIVEHQLGGADTKDNYELLEGSANGSSGSSIAWEMNKKIKAVYDVLKSPYYQDPSKQYRPNLPSRPARANQYVNLFRNQGYNISFESNDFNLETKSGNPDQHWKYSDIEGGQHLDKLEGMSAEEIEQMGNESDPALFISPSGGKKLSIPEESEFPKSQWLPRVDLKSPPDFENKTLAIDAYKAADMRKNTISASYSGMTWYMDKIEGTYIFYVDKQKTLDEAMKGTGGVFQSLRLPGMSPIRVDQLDITENGFYGIGKVLPTVPFIADADIDIVIDGDGIRLRKLFTSEEFSMPSPFSISETTLEVSFGTQGLGISGQVNFGIDQVGEGHIGAAASTEGGFELEGAFNFDSELFDPAEITVEYKDNIWTIGGEIGIPEGKVRGVKSATINATYSENTFSATGEAELDIPGIERGAMSIEYGDEGFSIGGNFDLSSDIPGISGGNVAARVSKESGAEEYDVFVSGTAQPDIPGISSELSVTYENGALTIEGRASYERGMLSGTIEVGATNRAIGENGEPIGEPDDTMRVYGGGSLTLQLTPWLEATAGVTFTPEGEIEVTARLASDRYEVFSRREVNRNLFTVPTIEIPLFAIPLGPRSIGLVAQIGGGLDFTAGFGPGELRNMSAEITYNPEREEETTVAGHGEFAIPADAGLTLRGDLSLGVSVGIASLTGGIELAGSLGLEGEAAAEVDVNWSPQTGLALDAEGRVTVNPKFTFDLNAFARASLGIGWFSVSETWRHNLASYEWGPDIQFGVVFPVHYREGEAFDMSFDDIEVIYPDLDVIDMAKGLARDVKNDIFS